MEAAGGLAAGVLLFFASVTLIGCGGGDDAPPVPSPLKLVSQTYHCKEIKTDAPQAGGVPPKMSYNLVIDAEGLKWRSDVNADWEVESPAMNGSVKLRISTVFDLATRRHTMSNFSEVMTSFGKIPPTSGCIYFEVPQLQEADVRACLDKEFGSMPLSSDGCPSSQKCYVAKTEETLDTLQTSFLHVDGDMVWKNILNVQTSVKANENTPIRREMPSPNSSPGFSLTESFQIPVDWGSCTKATADQINAVEFASMTPPFLTECAGLKLQNSQAQLMKAKLQQLVTKHTDHLLKGVV